MLVSDYRNKGSKIMKAKRPLYLCRIKPHNPEIDCREVVVRSDNRFAAARAAWLMIGKYEGATVQVFTGTAPNKRLYTASFEACSPSTAC